VGGNPNWNFFVELQVPEVRRDTVVSIVVKDGTIMNRVLGRADLSVDRFVHKGITGWVEDFIPLEQQDKFQKGMIKVRESAARSPDIAITFWL
jgi:hypothetical protein